MRARHDHDLVVGGLQKKYEKEIKHLKETIDKLNEDLHDKVKVLEWWDFFKTQESVLIVIWRNFKGKH